MDIVLDVLSWEEPFEPMDMPDLAILLRVAEWHDWTATELARSGSDVASSHRRTAQCLREVYDYMRRLRSILTEEDDFFASRSVAERVN